MVVAFLEDAFSLGKVSSKLALLKYVQSAPSRSVPSIAQFAYAGMFSVENDPSSCLAITS